MTVTASRLTPNTARQSNFTAKAEGLNASDFCVIEGSFGKDYGKFCFAIKGKPNYFVRFTRDELKN